MNKAAKARLYVVLKAEKQLLAAFRQRDLKQLLGMSSQLLTSIGAPAEFLDPNLVEVVHAPSTELRSTIANDPDPVQQPGELILSYAFANQLLLERFYAFLMEHLEKSGKDGATAFVNIGADPRGFFGCDLARPSFGARFGNRAIAREMLGIGALTSRGLTGRGTNVVVVDRGLNRDAIVAHDPESWGGGLTPMPLEPGTAPPLSHGMTIARNILDIAPKAKLYDVPLIPPRITGPSIFASDANSKLRAVVEKIRQLRKASGQLQSWILVNAWAIYDRSTEVPLGDYTQDLRKCNERSDSGTVASLRGHPLNLLMGEAVHDGIDVVFAAGNCGVFSKDRRCGKHDRGEKHSIWGANAHPAVVTVGATSCDDTWMGYSSQGPQVWRDGSSQKPDICAPSQFCENNNACIVNSGTSAAAALTAGVMAAIRGSARFGPMGVPPLRLKEAMIATARSRQGGWNDRTGHGMLNALSLVNYLERPSDT